MEDPILFWNAIALECNRLDHSGPAAPRNQRGPTLSSRALAIAHVAMHDAYVLTRAGEGAPVAADLDDPYLAPGRRPAYSGANGGAQVERKAGAAVSAAAAATLLNLYPARGDLIEDGLNRIAEANGASSSGHAFGQAVAHAVLALRRADGAQPDPDDAIPDYAGSLDRGRHREDPLNPGQPFLGFAHGRVRPFAITEWHAQAKHPEIGSAAYLTDYDEVFAKGAAPEANHCTRTPDETAQGLFWAYDGAEQIGTPPRLYNQVLRVIARDKALSVERNARLFLLANLAMADAGIEAWFYKYHYDLWRPVVGVREHDPSMGPAAEGGAAPLDGRCDPFWRPLGAPKTNDAMSPVRTFTPPFPAYPSGHATFGAAAFHSARLYLAAQGLATIAADGTDDIAFDFVSDEMNGRSVDPDDTVRSRHVRRFAGLHQAIYENSVSRVYLGVHWRFDGTTGTDPVSMLAATDMIGGVPLGLAIAADIAGNPMLGRSPATVRPPAFDATP
jgi:vanadium chloroperoxidase